MPEPVELGPTGGTVLPTLSVRAESDGDVREGRISGPPTTPAWLRGQPPRALMLTSQARLI